MRTPGPETRKSHDRSHSYFTSPVVTATSRGFQETRRQVTWMGFRVPELVDLGAH